MTCPQLCTEEMSLIIIQFHVMTGCDSNSCLFGHGKKKLFEKCKKSTEARDLLKECGNSLQMSEDVMLALKTFVMKYVYSDTKSKTISQSRALKWKQQKKKSIARLPPNNDS